MVLTVEAKNNYEYLLFDGVSVRIRLAGQVKRRMVLCAYGITHKGQRELIDFLIVKTESEDHWKTFCLDLHRRGLKGAALQLITTDGHPGLDKALHYTWPLYQAAHRKEALKRFQAWKEQWKPEAPKAVGCLEEDLEAMLAFFDCSKGRWIKVRTTNIIERAFVEVRRRIRTMCSFTTQSSCERILYSVFNRMNSNWEQRPL